MNKGLIGAVVGVTVAVAGWFWVQSRTAGEPLPASISNATSNAPGAPMAQVVVPTGFSSQVQQGETYFNAVCSACHGANAAGQDGIAPPLVHRIYEPSHHGDAAFVQAARNGVQAHHWRFGDMPPIEQRLADGELAAIIAYVRELQRANGIN